MLNGNGQQYSGDSGWADKVILGASITAADLSAKIVGDDLQLTVANPDPLALDQMTFRNWWLGSQYWIESFQFADGSSLTASQMHNLAMTGTEGNDVLTGFLNLPLIFQGLGGDDTLTATGGNNTMDGGAGNDTINASGVAGNSNTIVGGSGNDTITIGGESSGSIDAGSGDDVVTVAQTTHRTWLQSLYNVSLTGAQGNDTLTGGAESDTYMFGRGDGQDLISDNSVGPMLNGNGQQYTGNSGWTDVAQLSAGIAKDQVWLQQSGNDLVVSIIGEPDQFTVKDWYLGTQYRLEQFKTAAGDTLLEAQVQNLVDAMAAFAPPAPGQYTLPPEYAQQLDSVITANWE
jgi:Ca2+-binding RTX toxin-like protein